MGKKGGVHGRLGIEALIAVSAAWVASMSRRNASVVCRRLSYTSRCAVSAATFLFLTAL